MNFSFFNISVLSFLIILACNDIQSSGAASTRDNLQTKQTMQQETVNSIIYIESTRGFYRRIVVTPTSITLSNDRQGKKETTRSLEKEDWNIILTEIENINLGGLINLEPPSKKFETDGAPMTTLEIHNTDQIFTTQTFDKGNPPEEIKGVVDLILKMNDSSSGQ